MTPKYTSVEGIVYRNGEPFAAVGSDFSGAAHIAEAMNLMQLEPGLIAKRLLWANEAEARIQELERELREQAQSEATGP
jgi:hypothetical protein